MKIKDLLSRALQRIRERGRPDEAEPRGSGTEETVKALLSDLVDRALEAEKPGGIFTLRPSRPDREHYVQAVMLLLEEARDAGRAEAEEVLLDRVGWECACRCKQHGKIGCPRCLNVWGCPVHSEVTADQLSPDLLRDPELLARTVHATYNEIARETSAPRRVSFRAWDDNSPAYRAAFAEAMRRVVVVRVTRRKP